MFLITLSKLLPDLFQVCVTCLPVILQQGKLERLWVKSCNGFDNDCKKHWYLDNFADTLVSCFSLPIHDLKDLIYTKVLSHQQISTRLMPRNILFFLFLLWVK